MFIHRLLERYQAWCSLVFARLFNMPESPPQRDVRVECDDIAVSLFAEGKWVWGIRWSDMERIGYRTTPDGPWADDHFIVFKSKDSPPLYYEVSFDWKGATELNQHVLRLPGAKLTERGSLANCVDHASVTVWPGEYAGEPLSLAPE